MNWVEQTLADFGRRLGIDNLTLNAQGVTQLQLQSGLLLAVEHVENQVLVYIGQMLAFEDDTLKLLALKAVDFRNAGLYTIQLGVSGSGMDERLVILTRVTDRKFTLQFLEQAFEYLCNWYDAMRRK